MKSSSMRRSRRQSSYMEVDTEGSWAISYGDMITLLLSFFIIFFSTDKEKDRLKAMEASLLMVLNSNSDPMATPKSQTGSEPQVDEEIKKKLAAAVHRVGPNLIVEFPNVSFFGFGNIHLTSQGANELAKFTKLYMPYAGNYILGIRAFTDHKRVLSNPGRRYSDNLELSALRSVATMRVLQSLGIPLNRMRIGGYGELKITAEDLSRLPASDRPNASDSDLRALARKIVLVIEPEPRGAT